MKKIIFSTILLITFLKINAQIEFGIRAGLSSVDLITNSIEYVKGEQSFKLQFNESEYGHHFGLYSRLSFLGIYIEPNLMFSSNKVSYTLSEFTENGFPISVLKNETYHNLDIPVFVGIKAGIIRVYAGPVAHLHISSSSDLFDINGYSQRFKSATYGYQAGFGLDIWKLRFDVAYEGNLSKFGDHISIDGNDYSFSDSASRLLGTVSYAF